MQLLKLHALSQLASLAILANAGILSSLEGIVSNGSPQIDQHDARFDQYVPAGPGDCQSSPLPISALVAC